MKKVITVLIAIILLSSVAIAETDLSAMPYDDLIALQKEIALEIMSRPEWKEVNVPSGDWKVGEDIPAGTYSIKGDTSYGVSLLDVWGKEKGDYSASIASYVITDDAPIGKLELKDGWTVSITYTVVFTPYVSLGF